jgi:hypothetical protein
MTDEREPSDDDPESQAVRALLKRSLARDAEDAPDLLPGIQRRLRKRSRGKFFADGWSTANTRTTYLLMGLSTILLVALAYIALGMVELR